MKTMKQRLFARMSVITSLLIGAVLAPTLRADALESARLLPDDVAVMISVESVRDLQAALAKTSLYNLYKDPALQQVGGPAEKKIRAQIDAALKDFWHQAKLENPPEQIPYPDGRVVLGLSLVAPPKPAEVNVPVAGPSAQDEDDKDDEEADDGPPVLVRLALLADLGNRAAQAREVVQALSAHLVGANGTLQKKELAGISMDVWTPPTGKDNPMICYGFKDNWLLVTLDETKRLDFTEAVARRVGRTVPGSLADKAGFRAAVQTLGDAHVFVFLNPDALKELLAAMGEDKGTVARMIKGLGFTNVTGLAGAVRIAGDKGQEVCLKGLLGIQGVPTGVPALLGPASGSLKVSDRLLTREAMGFVCAQYEPAKLFDDLNKIVQDTDSLDLNMMLQAALAATAGDGGQPPVQLRDDVLAQIGTPLLVTWKTDQPYRPGSALKFLIALPVRDANRLDAAVGRMHKVFLGADPKLRRELLNHALYLLPAGAPQMALAVAGDHLVFGPVDEVEQAIRSLQKEPEDALASDPTFRAVRERLPSQAALYYYRNDRRSGEFAWAMLRERIRSLAAQPQGQDQKDEAPNPVEKAIQSLAQSLDLSQLPDFKAVEKYWGATVGFLQRRPEGLYGEMTSLKPAEP